MTAQVPIEHETLVNMTSKGQVLIPKAIRDAQGLRPGPVRVGVNGEGETVVLPGYDCETPDERAARARAAIEAFRGKYPNPDGMNTDAYMRWLRGDWEP